MKMYCTYCRKDVDGDYKNCPDCHSILTIKKQKWTSITKAQFKAYEEVRRSGLYNMAMDCVQAANEAGLDLETYKTIIENYSNLRALYKNII